MLTKNRVSGCLRPNDIFMEIGYHKSFLQHCECHTKFNSRVRRIRERGYVAFITLWMCHAYANL